MSTSVKRIKKNRHTDRIKCDLFGDMHRLRYDASKNQIVADFLLSATDVRRLLETVVGYYAKKKTKRTHRILELASELAKLIDKDGMFFAEGTAYVASGDAVSLESDREWLERNFPPDIRDELSAPIEQDE